MEMYVKKILFPYFLFYSVIRSNLILSDALILPISQLQTQRMMTSQIRSNIEYLIHTLYSYANFVVEIYEKCSLDGGF